MLYHLVIRIVFVVVVQNMNDSMLLRHLFVLPDSIVEIKWQLPRLQQCHIIVGTNGLAYVNGRTLQKKQESNQSNLWKIQEKSTKFTYSLQFVSR